MTKPKNVTPPAELALIAQSEQAVVTTGDRLATIADLIREEYGRGLEAQFAIGRLLMEAFDLHNRDKVAYGHWLAGQTLPIGTNNGWLLRIGAEREDEVRAYIEANPSKRGEGEVIGVTTAVKALKAIESGKGPKPSAEVLPVEDATPVDPAYSAMRAAHRAVLGSDEEPTNAFRDMHAEDLVASAGFIKDLVGAYTEAKSWRSMTQAEREGSA